VALVWLVGCQAESADDSGDVLSIDNEPVGDVGAQLGGELDAGGDDAAPDAADPDAAEPGARAFPPVEDLASDGPFDTDTSREGPNCTVWRPADLGEDGRRHPVILWANGTGGPSFVYQAAFVKWASHGFIVVATNLTDGQGDGAEMIECLDYVLEEDATPGSPLEGAVDREHIGASGHSQGGAGALMAGQDPRITATAPLMPYIAQGFGGFDQASIGNQTGPMLLLSGTADTTAEPEIHQRPVFEGANVPVFWGNLMGGHHSRTAFGIPVYRDPMLAWWRLQLMGDEDWRDMFHGPDCGLCVDDDWIVERKDIE
jgi:hypothetical protein